HGRPPGTKAPSKPDLYAAGGRAADRMLITDRAMLSGPVGFAPPTVAAIRCRSLETLGNTNRPEAVSFLAFVATGTGTPDEPQSENAQVQLAGSPEKQLTRIQYGADLVDRDVRLAAVRGLAKCRQPEAVIALAQVLTKEEGKDGALVGRSHDGL